VSKITQIIFCIALAAGSAVAADHQRAIVHSEDPQYPEVAKKLSLHGVVKLKVWITAQGAVRKLEYIGGHPLLAESALQAVKNWKYAPAAQESEMTVEIKF
jgi:periplasmic protein TonB